MSRKSQLIDIEKILEKHVNKYNKRFEFYQIVFKWKLQFVVTTICVKSKRMYSNSSRCGLQIYLVRKNEYFRRQELRFSHILEMNISFISSLNLMTYEQYINQPMQMVTRIPNKKL